MYGNSLAYFHFVHRPQIRVFHSILLEKESIDLSSILCIWQFNPFPNKPLYLHICSTSLSKTQWEKEKLLVTRNFSFSCSVFYQFGELSAIFIKLEFVVCKLFHFRRVWNLSFGKGLSFLLITDKSWHLTHYQTTNFRLFQTERVCWRQFQIWWKWQKVIQTGRKHCGERRNCSLRSHSVFKRCHCVGMG